MRVACSECAVTVDLEGLRSVDGGFGFICNHCGQINVLAPMAEAPEAAAPAAAPEPAPEPLPPGMVQCPKCAHRQYDKAACHRCGLDFARVADGTARFKSDPLVGHPMAGRVRPMWARLRRDLDDRAGHEDFIRVCAEHGLLEFAGQCYRKVLSEGAEEDARVRAYRDRVINAAIARADGLESRARRAVTQRSKAVVLAIAVVLIIGVLVAGMYFFTHSVPRGIADA